MNITFVHLEKINRTEKIVNYEMVVEEQKFMVHIKQLNVKNAFITNTSMFHFTGVIDAVLKINKYVEENIAENVVFDCQSVKMHEGEELGRVIIKNIKMDYDAMKVLMNVLNDSEENNLH